MYDVSLNITETLENYQQLISDYSVFLYIFLALVVFGIILVVNKNTPVTFYFTLGAFLLLVVMTFYFRRLELFEYIETMFTQNFYKNIYFFHWNMIFCFLLMHSQISSKKITEFTRILVIIFYVLLATNISFQLYMTDVVGGSRIMVLGNTAPMIILGNLVSFVLYLYLIVFYLVSYVKEKQR